MLQKIVEILFISCCDVRVPDSSGAVVTHDALYKSTFCTDYFDSVLS